MVQQYVKGNVQKDKQIGKFNKRTRQITSHTTLSLRTQESGKGLRNLSTVQRRQKAGRYPQGMSQHLFPSSQSSSDAATYWV